MYQSDGEGFEAYQTYLAIKQHFTRESYDFFKYEGKVTAKFETFKKRNDKYFFTKLKRNYRGDDLIWFLVANLNEGKNIWIGDLVNKSDSKQKYMKFKKKVETLEYTFRQDCETLLDCCDDRKDFNNMFKVVDNKHPTVVKLVLQNKIEIESFILLNELLGFIKRIDAELDEPYIWGNLKNRCAKYKDFIVPDDMGSYKMIMKKVIVDNLQ